MTLGEPRELHRPGTPELPDFPLLDVVLVLVAWAIFLICVGYIAWELAI